MGFSPALIGAIVSEGSSDVESVITVVGTASVRTAQTRVMKEGERRMGGNDSGAIYRNDVQSV